jgi:hypothetical protein
MPPGRTPTCRVTRGGTVENFLYETQPFLRDAGCTGELGPAAGVLPLPNAERQWGSSAPGGPHLGDFVEANRAHAEARSTRGSPVEG